MVNKQGQTRLAQYYEYMTVDERAATEAEIIRKCLARNEMQVFVYCIRKFVHLLRSPHELSRGLSSPDSGVLLFAVLIR